MNGDGKVLLAPICPASFACNIWIAFIGPIHKQRPADNCVPLDGAPKPAVVTVVSIIAHYEKLARRNGLGTKVVADQGFLRPRLIAVDRRIRMDLVRLILWLAIQNQNLVPNLNGI